MCEFWITHTCLPAQQCEAFLPPVLTQCLSYKVLRSQMFPLTLLFLVFQQRVPRRIFLVVLSCFLSFKSDITPCVYVTLHDITRSSGCPGLSLRETYEGFGSAAGWASVSQSVARGQNRLLRNRGGGGADLRLPSS